MAKNAAYITTSSGERIDFILDCSDRKSMSLSVREGKLTVRTPRRFDSGEVKGFIEDNLEWIRKSLSKTAERCGLPRSFEAGERIRLLGQEVIISPEISDIYFPPRLEGNRLVAAVRSRDHAVRQINGFIYSLAQREIGESMERLSRTMGLYPRKVTVKSLDASWGRCSSGGNISINYKVVTFPKRCIDYVCVHELAHLRFMDHSRDFWRLVEKYCPDWREIRAGMR